MGSPESNRPTFAVTSNRELVHPTPQQDLDLPILPERGDRLLSALEQIRAWVSETNADGEAVWVSPSVLEVIGFEPHEILDADSIEFHPDDLPSLATLGHSMRETGQPTRAVYRMRHKAGHWVWMETSTVAFRPTADAGFHTVSMTRDLTHVVVAWKALEESQARHQVISEMSHDIISEIGTNGEVTYFSPKLEATTGYTEDEIRAAGSFAFVHPDDRARVERDAMKVVETENAAVHIAPFRFLHKSGRWLWFESTGLTYRRADDELRLLTMSRDITERRKEEERQRELERRMQESQRLESLGVLAGGVAHDFNNLLTPILGAASLALDELPAGSPVRERLEKIQQAAQHASGLVNQMLSYAGRSPVLLERVDLSRLVEDMQQLLESAVSGDSSLDFTLAADLPPVDGDAAQLSQIVMNLISNAGEALTETGGRVVVRTGVEEVAEPLAGFALSSDALVPGRHVFFEVEDTGHGIGEGTRGRMFDPFFTTKFTGRGLGLAAVAGIVRGHRGAIRIDSEPGRGTTIRVLVPVAPEGLDATTRTPARSRGQRWEARGTVLVIDDDPGVLDLIQEVLARTGLVVVTAQDARAGVEQFREHDGGIDLVILDRTMPTTSGREAFEEIRTLCGNTPVLIVSGFSRERATANLPGDQLAGFLKKPFLPDTLVDCVRGILEGADAR